MTRINPKPEAKPAKAKAVAAGEEVQPVTTDRHADPPDVEAWRAKAQAADLPASLVDWLVMHDADAELWADAIGSWTASGRWSSPDRGCKWGE